MFTATPKKVHMSMSVMAATFLLSGLGLTLPTFSLEASASSAITVSSTSIRNGEAQQVTFGSSPYTIPRAPEDGTQKILCFFKHGRFDTNGEGNQYVAGDVVPTFISVAAGTIDEKFNRNEKISDRSNHWAWIDVVKIGNFNPACNELPQEFANIPSHDWSENLYFSAATITHSASWTVRPALDSPISQTIYVNEDNTTPATVTGSYVAEVSRLASYASSWQQRNLNDCASTGLRVDLSAMGLTLDPTVSSAGEFAPLLVSGSPTSSSVGTYRLCLRFDSGTDLHTLFDLTIAAERPTPAPPSAPATTPTPVLASTGANADKVTSTFTAGIVAIVFGALMLMMRIGFRRS
jgi:hypothetical protein